MASLRSERATLTQSSEGASFWGESEALSIVKIRPRLAVAADLALRQLDPVPLGDAAGVIDELRPLYEGITSGAVALAFGEEPEPPGS